MVGHESSNEARVAEGNEDVTSYDPADSWSGLPAAPEAADPLIGTTLHDTYVVDHVLGEGGMGRVYEARHTRLPNKRFAIKVLHAELALNADLQLRFAREAETAASIDHPGVVGIYDMGRTPQGWQYIVCEHLTGLELHRHIKQSGHLSQTSVVHIGRQLCEAIDAAHEKTVIHRDLKPHNIFLVGDFSRGVPERPRVKVLDFGLSRFMGGDSQLTKTGVIMGTPGYMAPEQAHGRHADHRTDVYGVGAILYAAATGRPPFVEETPQRTVLAVMSGDPERPRLVQPSISEGLEIVIQRAMAREPLLRYRDLKEMGRALTALETGPMTSLLPPTLPRNEHGPPPEESKRTRLRFMLLVLAAASLLLLGAWSALLGLLSLRGMTPEPTNTELVLLGALGAMSCFPVVLLLRRVRRTVWGNTARLVDWLPVLRGPLITGLSAYGLAAFVVRFCDEVLPPLRVGGLWGQGPGVAYRGYSVVLPLIGLIAALGAAAHRRWWSGRRPVRRWVFGPALAASLSVCSAALLYFTLQQRARAAPPAPLASAAAAPAHTTPASDAPATPASDAPATPASETLAAPAPGAEAEPAAAPSASGAAASGEAGVAVASAVSEAERAPQDALVAAVAEGSPALRTLAQRYPRDQELLKALFIALASKGDTLEEALETSKALLAVAPARNRDPEVRYVVTRSTERGGLAAELAFNVLSENMGQVGADLLYDLMLRKPALEWRTKQALRDARRRDHFSLALAIAYDLRFAPSCASRLGMLARAQEFGDERSITVLSGLAAKPSGCKRTRTRKCRPRCEAEAPRFYETMERIARRLRAQAKG